MSEVESLDDRVQPVMKSLLRLQKVISNEKGCSQFTTSVASSSQEFVTCDEEVEELEGDMRNLLYAAYDYKCF